MKKIIGIVSVCSLMIQGCGTNNGTQMPESRASRSSNVSAPVNGSLLVFASNNSWRGDLIFDQTPNFNQNELVEYSGDIYLRTASGDVPLRVTQLVLRADLPELGQGTGRVWPEVLEDSSDAGHFSFKNLFLSMTGMWRLRVSATVDGRPDVWNRMVDVK